MTLETALPFHICSGQRSLLDLYSPGCLRWGQTLVTPDRCDVNTTPLSVTVVSAVSSHRELARTRRLSLWKLCIFQATIKFPKHELLNLQLLLVLVIFLARGAADTFYKRLVSGSALFYEI